MKYKKLKLVTKILAIIIICLISFCGIYVQKFNKMENIVKDYEKSKDLTGYREITFEVSTGYKVYDSDGEYIGTTDNYTDSVIEDYGYTKSEEKVNSDEILTEENFEKSQKVIEKRLTQYGIKDYSISVDKQSGKIYLQLPETDDTDTIISNIKESGEFKIADSSDGTEYLNNDNLKSAKVMYSQSESGTTVFIELQLDKNGTEILKDITTNKYATLPEEDENDSVEEEVTDEDTSENDITDTESEDDTISSDEDSDEENGEEKEEVQNKVSLLISGSKILSQSFDEPLKDGKIDLAMSSETTSEEKLQQYFESATKVAVILDNGALPISYTLEENKYVATEISDNMINQVIIGVLIVFAILLIYMVIKYKRKGLLSAICFIGFIATYLLVLRYTNVVFSIESIVSIIVVLGINYVLNLSLMKIEDGKLFNKKYLDVILKLIPALAISIVFCFANWSVLINFGMTMFWGIILMLIYNILITKNIVND